MGSDGLGLTRSLEHEELWQDGDGFQPDGEGPKNLIASVSARVTWLGRDCYLREAVLVGEEDSQHCSPAKQVLHFECIQSRILSRLIVVQHEVDSVARGDDEEDLEARVPDGEGEGPEDICSK